MRASCNSNRSGGTPARQACPPTRRAAQQQVVWLDVCVDQPLVVHEGHCHQQLMRHFAQLRQGLERRQRG
jgi:hypothetical protein